VSTVASLLAAADPSVAEQLVGKGAAVLAVLAVAVAVRWLLHRAVTRLIRRAANGIPTVPHLPGRAAAALRDVAEPTERRTQRAETIGALLRSIVTVFVFGIAFVEVLGIAGLDLAPIVASAGIAGVALGFGAQNLVKDFLNGIAMILEDQYGVGDVIDAGPATGTVEGVGLRVTRVRDVHGTVWHIRNGEVLRVGNMSQGWSRAVLDVPVGYAEDPERVRRVLKAAADEVWHDPELAVDVLEEPEVWGVEEFGLEGMRVRVVVKTAPMRQYDVARALRQRVKAAFDREGITIPVGPAVRPV
jgi:small conductance mechanosensitive channel